MVVDFAKLKLKEQPLLILQNLDDTPIGVLGAAFNVEVDLCYNDISTLTFDLPAYVDGKETPNYKRAAGMRIVDLQNYGRFMMIDPKIDDDGVKQIKSCTAYSLEYEFTFKRMQLTEGTYNFWNPLAKGGTILGMILEQMPSWKVGTVDTTLIDKYRTFDDSGDQNIYNFMKSQLQESYGCIFYFDTYNRIIHVRDIMTEPKIAQAYFSLENLIKDISIDEDTESIVTCLNVYGADGVDIRSVNPMGTSYIVNLDYFMTTDNFSQAMIDKYNNWKETFSSYQRQYFNLTVEEALKTAQLVTEQAALVTLQGEYTSLENIQAVIIQAIAQGLKTQRDLDEANANLRSKEREITAKQREIDAVQAEVDSLDKQMVAINERTHISKFFTEDEYKIINRYMKEDSVSEDSFVIPEVANFDAAGESITLSSAIFNIGDAKVTMTENFEGKDIYSISGGTIACSTSGFVLSGNIIRASLDYTTDKKILFTARISNGVFNGKEFPSACISIAGDASAVTSNVRPNTSVGGAISEGSTVQFRLNGADTYFTTSTTEYEQRSVEWDLFDYGTELLEKLAWPNYTCSLDIVNFLALSEYEPYKNSISLGDRVYWKQRDGTLLTPILVKVHIPFEDLSKFSVEFSSKYNASDMEFSFMDLLEDSITAGKSLDSGKWSYNQFVNSGANTAIGDFMRNALDIAKNNIISSTGQAISWDEAGLRLRKRLETSAIAADTTQYDPFQIWMNNSSIMFTNDNWATANLAIGQIITDDGTINSGVIADALIGKLLAGNSLIIESAKKDGGVAVFRVDGNGASLHNATFDLYCANQTQITLNPYSGFALGKYPLYTGDEYAINETNAKFWVDMQGNVHIKGTLHGVDGTFSGELVAATGRFKGTVQAAAYQDLSGRNMMTGDYKFGADYLELKGLNVNNNFIVDSNGNVTMRGNITMTGGSISWNNINERDSRSYQLAVDAGETADDAYGEALAAADNVRKLANGRYSGTFIDGKKLISPEIYTNMLKVTVPDDYEGIAGLLLSGYIGGKQYDVMKISNSEEWVTFSSPCSAYCDWNFPRTEFNGYLDFRNAIIENLSATFG